MHLFRHVFDWSYVLSCLGNAESCIAVLITLACYFFCKVLWAIRGYHSISSLYYYLLKCKNSFIEFFSCGHSYGLIFLNETIS